MGFPLAAVREVLGCYDDPKALERCLLLQRAGAKEVMEKARGAPAPTCGRSFPPMTGRGICGVFTARRPPG